MSDYLNCLGCQNTCYPRFPLYNQRVQLGNLAKRILCRESEHLSKFDVNKVIISAWKVNFIASKKHKLKQQSGNSQATGNYRTWFTLWYASCVYKPDQPKAERQTDR